MAQHRDLILLERLAYGGMAEVYRAKQLGYQGFEKIVAVKRILPQFASQKNFKKLFVHEANLSATLEHPNIAHVFANGENAGSLFLIMEFIEGRNIRQLSKKAAEIGKLIPIEVSCYIVSEFLKGLEYAHNRKDNKGVLLNIVHRDISPQNIMLSYEGSVKIVDFGIAKVASSDEASRGSIVGKFSYMSPEQAAGQAIDKRSDIYSAGIILWELLTGERLFHTDNDMKTLAKVKEGIIPSPSAVTGYVPSALEKIVVKALEREPHLRYASCLEFYSDLIRFLNTRRSGFIPTDFASFMKELFYKEIHEVKVETEIKIDIKAADFSADNSKEKEEITRVSINPNEETDAYSEVTPSPFELSSAENPLSAPPLKEPDTSVRVLKEEPRYENSILVLKPDDVPSSQIRVMYEAPKRRQTSLNLKPRTHPFVKFLVFALLLGGIFAAYWFIPQGTFKIPRIPWREINKLKNDYLDRKAKEADSKSLSSEEAQSSATDNQWSAGSKTE